MTKFKLLKHKTHFNAFFKLSTFELGVLNY